MRETILNTERAQSRGLGWKSMDQLAEMWGMDPSRARLVVGALLDTGRMEQQAQSKPVFRLVS